MLHLLQPLMGLISGDIEEHVAHARRHTIVLAIVGLLGLTAYGFALAALALWLSAEFGSIQAMLGLCAGTLLLALIVFGTAKLMHRVKKRRQTRDHNSEAMLMTSLGVSLLPMLMRSRPLGLAAIAGGIAFAVSRANRPKTAPQAELPRASEIRRPPYPPARRARTHTNGISP